MIKTIICIVCPNSCKLEIDKSINDEIKVSGYRCYNGKQYAQQEMINPRRTLTATLKINNGSIKRLPVKSEAPIQKELMLEIMKIIRVCEVEAPIHISDIIFYNILNTGINIISSKNVEIKIG